MNALVVYTSVSGGTRTIASEIAGELGAELVGVHGSAEKRSPRAGPSWDDVKGLKELPLETEGIDPSGFDLILLGTPILMWAPSPVIRAFLLQYPIRGRSVAAFSTSEGDVGKGLNKLTSLLEGNRLLGTRDFPDPKKDPASSGSKARSWAREIAGRFEGTASFS